MEKLPLISVIIPAYNARQTLERACDSVLNQAYSNLELIVIDDGSKDDTGLILDALAEKTKAIHAIHQENGGVCRARNTGIAAAKGEYIFFLDADDELVPGCLEKLQNIAESTGCGIVAGPCIDIRPDGERTPNRYAISAETEIWTGKEGVRQSLLDNPATYSVWGKLYRRDAIGDIRFVEGKRIHEDSFFLFEVLTRETGMAVSNIHTVNYYLTQGSASRAGFSEKFLDILYFADRKMQLVKSQYPEFEQEARNMLVKANMALLKAMALGGEGDYRDVENWCIHVVNANARYFKPAITIDKILFLFIRLRVFWLYKQIYRLLRR